MRTQADRNEDLALGRELERKDAEIARLQGIIDKAFANLDVALASPADEIARLRAQIEDAEIALNVWDGAHDSEYWLRHPRDPGDLVSGALEQRESK